MDVPLEDLVAAARESLRREGDGCVLFIHQLLDELSDKFGDRFHVTPDVYKVLELIETLWADPHIDQVPDTESIEFAWNETGAEPDPVWATELRAMLLSRWQTLQSTKADMATAQRAAINPTVDDIADRAKYRYATGTQLLAAHQYRLAELAGTGQLDPDVSMSLQEETFRVWEELYFGTLCAVRGEDTADCTWDDADNTYSDGRPVMIRIRIKPVEFSESSWEYNEFLLGDGAVNEHPHGTICYLAAVNPQDDQVVRE